MTWQQLVNPDPFIPCTPGWCLQYVRQAFGAPVVEPDATSGWNNAQFKHTDDPPLGVWKPVWFAVQGVPEGHVVLMAPDNSVYSTTSPTGTTATHHPTLVDLYAAYAAYYPLTYRGWSEDISNVRVIQELTTVQVESADGTVNVDDLQKWLAGPFMDEIAARTNAQKDELAKQLADSRGVLMSAINNMPADDIVKLVPDALVDAVAKGLSARLAQ